MASFPDSVIMALTDIVAGEQRADVVCQPSFFLSRTESSRAYSSGTHGGYHGRAAGVSFPEVQHNLGLTVPIIAGWWETSPPGRTDRTDDRAHSSGTHGGFMVGRWGQVFYFLDPLVSLAFD